MSEGHIRGDRNGAIYLFLFYSIAVFTIFIFFILLNKFQHNLLHPNLLINSVSP